MSKCYRSGGCGGFEQLPCNECPASKPEYQLRDKNIDIYVAMLNGNVKDHYIAIACTEKDAVQKLVDAYFGETGHTSLDFAERGVFAFVVPFVNGNTINCV